MSLQDDLGMDMFTKRPRTPRDPYTVLTDTQKKNIHKVLKIQPEEKEQKKTTVTSYDYGTNCIGDQRALCLGFR